jgi:hypothetical protein
MVAAGSKGGRQHGEELRVFRDRPIDVQCNPHSLRAPVAERIHANDSIPTEELLEMACLYCPAIDANTASISANRVLGQAASAPAVSRAALPSPCDDVAITATRVGSCRMNATNSAPVIQIIVEQDGIETASGQCGPSLRQRRHNGKVVRGKELPPGHPGKDSVVLNPKQPHLGILPRIGPKKGSFIGMILFSGPEHYLYQSETTATMARL